MINLRQYKSNIEITLALVGAFGMMVMMLNPLIGQMLMGGSLSLLFVLYLLICIMPRDPGNDSRFQAALCRINFLVAACADALILVLLVILPGKRAIAMPALILLAICLALNVAHRYLYGIRDEGYFSNQIRLLVLAGLVALLLVDSWEVGQLIKTANGYHAITLICNLVSCW